jgi:class 3 adenylate cyclase
MVIFQETDQQHALNAASAALDVHSRTNEINRELEGRFEQIHVNMGINSGLVSVGVARFDGAAGTRMTFTATGPVTNLAARIAAAATKGDILLGPETARRMGGKIHVYSSGLRQFKNFRKPVKVFSLLRPA